MNKRSRAAPRAAAFAAAREAVHSFARSLLARETWRRAGKRARVLYRELRQIRSDRLGARDQAFFAKRLSFLITAGVPILEALTMLKEQGRSKAYARIIDHVIKDIANGQSLSKALGKYPNLFGEFAINLIRVGETSGTLSKNLDYLADELKKKQALRRRMVGALIYPGLITLATLGITAFLTLYLFPKIMPIFLSLRTELPLSTRIVIGLSTFLRHWGLPILALLAVLISAFVLARKRRPAFRKRADRALLALPVLGGMTRSYNIANATRTLGLLLKAGLTLSSALAVVAETTRNAVYRESFDELARSILRGGQLSHALAKRADLFPEIVGQMLSVGERSGNLANSLVYLSEFYEHEIENVTKEFSSLIEPALMIFMGVVIGFIAISIITPIYAITQSLHP